MSKLKEPGIPAYYLIIVILPVLIMLLIFYHHYNTTHLDNEVWQKEPVFSVNAKITKVNFDTESKGRSYWSYADLDNGDLLINPFNPSMLCHTRTMAQKYELAHDYSLHDLQDAVEAKSPSHLSLKKIPSNWIADGDKKSMKEDCPHVDFSGSYLTYRGRQVVELITLSD